MPVSCPTPADLAVLVCTRDRPPDVLERCLASVARQTGTRVCAYLHDDGSAVPVDVAALGEALGLTIDVKRTEHPLGVPGARNALLARCREPLALFLDDDALLVGTDALTRVLQAFGQSPRAAVMALRLEQHPPGRTPWVQTPLGNFTPRSPDEPRSGCAAHFSGGAAAVRCAAVREVGAFDADMTFLHEEIDLSMRLIAEGWEIRYLPVTVRHEPAPSAIAQAGGSEARWGLRNRLVIAYRYLPTAPALAHASVWAARHALLALRTRRPSDWSHALASAFRACVRTRRSPLDARSVAYLRHCGGRLWF